MIDIENLGQKLRVSYFDKDGEVAFKKFDIPRDQMWRWDYATNSYDKDAEWKSWDNKWVKKVPSNYLDKFRIEQFLKDLPDSEKEDIYEFNQPRKYFVDIEVEVTDSFPEPDIAPNPVTTIGITNDKFQITVLGLKELSAKEIDKIEKDINVHFAKYEHDWSFNYHKFDSEYDLLYTFFTKLVPKMPLITGWNFVPFDWKYLKNRCKKLKIQPEFASPSQKLMGRDELPQHRLIVDYLEIYKKYDTNVKIKESYSLDYTGKAVCGIEKVKYPGTIQQMYEKDFTKYVFYNAADTVLNYYIDYELNTLLTFLSISNVSKIEASRALSPIWITEACINRIFWERKRALFSTNKDKIQAPYEGAWVKKPENGMYDWIACFDFASLYPTTQRQFNISPETFVGMNIPLNDKLLITASGAVFDNKSDSVMRTFLSELYDKRVTLKDECRSIDKEIDLLRKELKKR